ncbi:hypothetical protein SLEP1_g29534 [Rubroshorea leprosula]|uniref:MADS-box domain-containing protein n=1 Tax=Rubroshorea leprosula TaxID=152421 RepID=A0AAV5K6F4_9ROSI|nr:hypothetical protein SLEP1_g29534 [Rubroshorea leprosula]
MVRVMLQLKKIENKAYKHISFAKRRSSLVKKAYQLSTLCDVEGRRGSVTFYPNPCKEALMLRQIISQLNLEASVYHHNTTSSGCGRTIGIVSADSKLEDVQNQILICNSQLHDVEREL